MEEKKTLRDATRVDQDFTAVEPTLSITLRSLRRAPPAAGIAPPPVDATALRATLDALAQQVRAAFVRHVGEIES